MLAKNENLEAYIEPTKVIEHIKQGYSLILNRIDRLSPELNSFSRKLESELMMEVQVNLYLTPAENYGFNIHDDSHDVFIIQLQGTKDWTLYKEKYSIEQESTGSQMTLKKGDVLYIPKGMKHQAKSTSETSMHLTIAIYPLLGYQLLKQLSTKVQEDDFFNKSVPRDNSSIQDTKAYYQEYAQKLSAFLTPQSLKEIIEQSRVKKVSLQEADYVGILENQFKSDSLNDETFVRLRRGVCVRLTKSQKILTIHMPQQNIQLPLFMSPFIEAVLEQKEIQLVSIKEIENAVQRVALIRKLIIKGFLEVSDTKE